MPVSDPAASAATSAHGAHDTQTLITLLGNLMPLLMRLQTQTLGPMAPGYGFAPFSAGPMAAPPTLDHQAAVGLAEDITADSLRRLSAYLEAHAERHPGLETCVPIVTQAAHCFAAHDYAQAFGLVWQAYRAIAMLRATDPQLPPLRAAGEPVAAPNIMH
jgi:hypothetical protein